jgi:Dicarboxylate carrier protein MatC N-terminus
MPPSVAATGAMAIFVAAFAIATMRGVHVGLLMFVAACAVGPGLAGMTLPQVIGGFPVAILILVAGVTFFFGIAQLNGTMDRVMNSLLAWTGGRPALMPLMFFGLAGLMAAMGSPQAGLATGPVGMSTARRARVDPVLMAIAINSGICAGAFAPTSLFGVITYRVAHEAGIDVSTFILLAVAFAANLVLLLIASTLFSKTRHATLTTAAAVSASPDVTPREETATAPAADRQMPAPAGPLQRHQAVTLLCLIGLVPGIVGSTLAGFTVDIGVVLLGLGALLALLDPSLGARAFARIDWSTAFVVCGIVTYVGVLQKLDAVNLLGREAMTIGTPLLAALVICMIAALVSAFASTTGVLAALVPMAVPLASSGAVPGWALITTLGVSATIVDVSPYSNTGATLIASAPEEDRPRLRVLLMRWSMAMVVVGPLVLLPVLRLFGR